MQILTEEAPKIKTQAELYRAIRKRLPPVDVVMDAEEPESAMPRRVSDGLTDDIRLLGALLGLIISEHEGADFYRFIERLRQASKEARSQSGRIGLEKIDAVIQRELSGLDETGQRSILHRAVAAFRLFLLLAGIAEEYYQSARFLQGGNHSQLGLHNLDEAVASAKRAGYSLEDFTAAAEKISARLVFTAHPTKILRQTILHHQRDIFYILKGMHTPELTSFRQQELLDELSEKIEVLWATQFSRWTKPEPKEEISRVLSYLNNTLYQTVPQVHQTLKQGLRYYYGVSPNQSHLPPMLSVGSWVGGDMDGNPFVTPEVFAEALIGQYRAILGQYAAELKKMLNKMSHAGHRVHLKEKLRASIEQDLADMHQAGEETRNYADLLEREPYRLKLNLIALKLEHTGRRNIFWAAESRAGVPFVYHSAQDLLDDLSLVAENLEGQGYHRSVRVRLQRIRETVQIFGFHFASIDLREESSHIGWAAQAILAASGRAPETSSREVLTEEILSLKVLNTRQWEDSPIPTAEDAAKEKVIKRILGMLSTARQAQRFIDQIGRAHV